MWSKKVDFIVYFWLEKPSFLTDFGSKYRLKSSSHFSENNVDMIVVKKEKNILKITLWGYAFLEKKLLNFNRQIQQWMKKERVKKNPQWKFAKIAADHSHL